MRVLGARVKLMRTSLLASLLASVLLAACGPTDPFVVAIVSFEPGAGAGFGQDALPEVVLGPPEGGGSSQGGTDVLSLGIGGVITLELGAALQDGAGPDLLVFENPFMIAATGAVFGEPGEVAVSDDGEHFIAFPCAPSAPPPNGCAGFGVVKTGSSNELEPTDPSVAGGDAFDLAELEVARARFVRITDRGAPTGVGSLAPSAGFDLDAVAAVSR